MSITSAFFDTACVDNHHFARKAENDDLTIEQIACLHESVMDNSTSPVDACKSPALIRVVDKIEAVMHSASNESRTAAL